MENVGGLRGRARCSVMVAAMQGRGLLLEGKRLYGAKLKEGRAAWILCFQQREDKRARVQQGQEPRWSQDYCHRKLLSLCTTPAHFTLLIASIWLLFTRSGEEEYEGVPLSVKSLCSYTENRLREQDYRSIYKTSRLNI